jgi:hypothetical protein
MPSSILKMAYIGVVRTIQSSVLTRLSTRHPTFAAFRAWLSPFYALHYALGWVRVTATLGKRAKILAVMRSIKCMSRIKVILILLALSIEVSANTKYCGEIIDTLVKWNLEESRHTGELSFSFPRDLGGFKILESAKVTYGENELIFETMLWPAPENYYTGFVTRNIGNKNIKVCVTYTQGSCLKSNCAVYKK